MSGMSLAGKCGMKRNIQAVYEGESRIRFVWPCGHYRIVDYQSKPLAKRMWPEACRLMVKRWMPEGLPCRHDPCPSCSRQLLMELQDPNGAKARPVS